RRVFVLRERIRFAIAIRVLVVVGEAALEAEEIPETMRAWTDFATISKMPFSDERRGVSVVAEEAWKRGARRRQTAKSIYAASAVERSFDGEALLIAAGDEPC